jgi:diaminohydroxyphosphoribosylaminopyrimidine deaminase/5-amino-6-(5-phosphoribosylamino)uracil reductase
MMNPVDRSYMCLALELAARGAGRTHPNPMVGCVIVKEGCIVGRGYHKAAGLAHAEVVALDEAGENARGATLYVTLEPCSHHGRTPPCADAVIAAGVSRVVVATKDPNPLVAGRGLAKIERAGIATLVGVERERALRLNEAFMLGVVKERAFVHLKLAATLDGKIATATGDSKWVTSPESRAKVHRLRDQVSAVLVGVQTAQDDDPRLTVRLPGKAERQLLRVVLDPALRISDTLWMLAPENAANTLLVCTREAHADRVARLEELGAKVLRAPPSACGGLDVEFVLRELYRLGHLEVLLEGGGRAARSFLDAGMVDRVHLYYAPKLLGGSDALSMVGGASPGKMSSAFDLDELEVSRVGPDIYVTGVISRKTRVLKGQEA